jgi:hypothetical protein
MQQCSGIFNNKNIKIEKEEIGAAVGTKQKYECYSL